MSEETPQLDLFGLPVADPPKSKAYPPAVTLAHLPEWARSLTPTQRKHVAAGRHPTGAALSMHGQGACGDCANLRRKECHGRHYLKCSLGEDTNGPGTDIRRRWPACTYWHPAPPEQKESLCRVCKWAEMATDGAGLTCRRNGSQAPKCAAGKPVRLCALFEPKIGAER